MTAPAEGPFEKGVEEGAGEPYRPGSGNSKVK